MTSLADKAILSGADNRPPMLEKDMYDSWKSRMELYMSNRQHGRMILESVENGPLLWPTVEENKVTRPKKYSKLSAMEAIQADCDVKTTNIILQRLPPEFYALYGLPYHSSHYASQAQSSTPLSITYPSNNFQSTVHHNVYNLSSSIPQVEYAPSVHQQFDFSHPDTGKQRIIVCYNCKGEGHMSKQCTKPKRKRYEAWFKDKYVVTNNAAYQAEDLDAYDSNYDEINSAKISLMANLSHCGSDNLANVHNLDNVTNNVMDQDVQAMLISEQSNIMNQSETKITSDSNIIPYSLYMNECQYATAQNSNSHAQQDDLILSVIKKLKTQVVNCTKINQDNKNVNEILTAELERYKDQKEESRNIDRELALEKQLEPMLYDGSVIQKTNAIVIRDSKETLMLEDESRSKMLQKQKDPMITMDMTIDQQVALDEALVPHTRRLRIRRRNVRLQSNISSKEFWVTTTVHHHSIRFKMDNKKHIVNLKYFREMLLICPRLPGQTFDEPPFEEEILAFLRFLGHNGEIRRLTDVKHKDTKKSNEIYYPRFTKVIIHHFMSKDPLIPRRNKVKWHYVRDDQMFTTIKLVSRHQNTHQFGAMLPIELTNADIRKSEAYQEYYVVATGVTPPKTKASVRKTKSSSDTTITPLPTAAAGTRLFTSAKGKQPATISKVKSLTALSEVLDVPTEEYDEEISWKSSDEGDDGDDDEEGSDEQDDDDAQNDDDDQDDADEEGEEFIHPRVSVHDEKETRDEESFNPILKTPKKTDNDGNGKENLGLNVGREEGQDEEDDEDELYRDVNINLEGRGVQMADVNTTQEVEDSHVTLTLVNPNGQQQSSSVSS
uniref:CCHC-type domain-containing protein n=1 Tax=Tanacetum cinerariifolium TaxID=118510 RepID=A0A6L2JY95_TANCI|nr:hypothetical protein [Tanacetum cinerariifolium]